jgi:hypothetical protein
MRRREPGSNTERSVVESETLPGRARLHRSQAPAVAH